MPYIRETRKTQFRVRCLDASSARLAKVVEACAACQPELEFLPGNSAEIEPGCEVASVGLARSAACADELRLIARLVSEGTRVLCYAELLPGTPVADRCQLLLAGASEVLNSLSSDFPAQLASMLKILCDQESARLSERSRLGDLMRRSQVAGDSEALFSIFRSVERLSAFSELPVLITGETGTGKDLVAQAIHAQDPIRCRHPFVPLNCGALDWELSGSELFGHRRGSFTGASQDRLGLFRAADRGVLFLDEIGELSLALQAKLLRVLQTGRVLGVGEDRESAVNVRIIAATNRDLREMVQAGAFREDLFHRINVTAIHIPPLRERPADIAPLLHHFLHRYAASGRRVELQASPEVLQFLQESRLPGNARQVENLVHHAFIHHEHGSQITLRDLPADLLHELTGQSTREPAQPKMPPALENGRGAGTLEDELFKLVEVNGWSLERSLGCVERLIVHSALRAAGGNQSEAARKLGITPRSIYNKLHRSYDELDRSA